MAGKISFLSVVNILLANKHRFVIEVADRWNDQAVLRLVAAQGYPNATPFIKKGDSIDQDLMTLDKNEVQNKLGGQVLLFYDTGTQRVIGATKGIYDLISSTKNRVTEKILDNVIVHG